MHKLTVSHLEFQMVLTQQPGEHFNTAGILGFTLKPILLRPVSKIKHDTKSCALNLKFYQTVSSRNLNKYVILRLTWKLISCRRDSLF
jgi:hypothetical protein